MSWSNLQWVCQAVGLVPVVAGAWIVFRNRALARCDDLAVATRHGAIVTNAEIRKARLATRVGQWVLLGGILIGCVAGNARFIAGHVHF